MKFGKIDHFIVLGGSLITLYFLKYLKKKKLNLIILQTKDSLRIHLLMANLFLRI